MGAIRVILAEDHALMRDAVKLVFERDAEVRLVGEVANGNDLVPLMNRIEADFLLDVQLPGLDGLGCLEALAKHHPRVEVAMLSAVEDPQVIESAFRRGARGYFLKSINPFDLPAAIRQIIDKTVIQLSTVAYDGRASASLPGGLSEKELAVLEELCHGHTNKQIAESLWLSEQTVKFHLRNIYRKLGINSRTEALRYAYEHDLVVPVAHAQAAASPA